MFRNTMGKGFQLTFENGYTISVQWGYGNYCENQSIDFASFETKAVNIDLKSSDAEVAIWDKNGVWCLSQFIDSGSDDDVIGHVSANEVAILITKVSNAVSKE